MSSHSQLSNIYYGTLPVNGNNIVGPFTASYWDSVGLQVQTDGTASVTVTLQGTMIDQFNQAKQQLDRDDTYGSNNWAPLSTQTIAVGSYQAVFTQATLAYKYVRLLLNNTTTATTPLVRAYIHLVSED